MINIQFDQKNCKIDSVHKAWITEDLLTLIRFKHYKHHEYNNEKFPNHGYNSFKNKLCSLMNASKN